MTKCEICLYPKEQIKEFKCFQPTLNKYETHKICEKCLNKLVEKHFSLIPIFIQREVEK